MEEMVPEVLFIVDGGDGNDIGRQGEQNNTGGKLTLNVQVELSKAEARKANLNRKQYLTKVNIEGNIEDDEALEALQPHINLEELAIQESRNITVAPKWLRMLSNLTRLHLSDLPNLQGLDPDIGCQLLSLKKLQLYSLPLVRQIEVVASGPVFPSLVHIELLEMENMEGWSLQSCNQDSSICFPKLSKIYIYNCPKLLKSGGSFPDCIMCPFPSPNCKIKLTICRFFSSDLEEEEAIILKIHEESFLPITDDGNDSKNNILFRCVDEIISAFSKSYSLPATLLNKFLSLETLTFQPCSDIESLDDIFYHHLPCVANTLKISRGWNLLFLSPSCNVLQTIFPSLETLVIEHCSKLRALVWFNIGTSLPSASVKTLIIKECDSLEFLPLPTLFPSLETLEIDFCSSLSSLTWNNDGDDSNELPPTINTLIVKRCDNLKLSAGTLQMLPSIQQVEIEDCKKITRQQQQHNNPSQ